MAQLQAVGHDHFIRTCLSEANQESGLVASAAVYAVGRQGRLDTLCTRLMSLMAAKTDTDYSGRLSAASFLLLLAEITSRRPSGWRQLSGLYVKRIAERGGPDTFLRASRSAIMALHLEFEAVTELFGEYSPCQLM